MNDTEPTTSTGRLQAAAEHIRYAAHTDPPATPAEVYDQIGALADIAAKLMQHLHRNADVLNALSERPTLRSTDTGDISPSLTTRTAAFRLRTIAGGQLAGLVRELNTAWTEVSGLHVAEPDGPCCEQHTDAGCCDPDDCGPCCPACPTCPNTKAADDERRA